MPGGGYDRGRLTIEQFALGDRRMREFARLPWRLYRTDPNWTPPLTVDLLGSRLLGAKGLLTAAHPYHEHAQVTHFLVRRGGRAVGRISGAVNRRFNEHYDARIGFFGFFEVDRDYEAAAMLLDAAREWIADRGMTSMRGPGEYSNATHERQAVLIDGFDQPPTVELTHNPPYYGEFLERWGLLKVKDYHAHIIDLGTPVPARVKTTADAIRAKGHVLVRTVDMSNFAEEVRTIIDIYNEAWAANWGFLPITPGEADALADTLKPIVDPGLIRFAYVGGEPIAVLGAFPDPNWALRPRWKWYGDSDPVRIVRLLAQRRRIPRVRLMFFGIRPGHRRAGIDAVLYDETREYALAHGYRSVEASMLLEENELILRAAESMGGHRYKTWRIYERDIDQTRM